MSSGNIVTKRLSTGQTIKLTAHEEKLLRQSYEYLAGYAKRQHLRNSIAAKNKEFDGLASYVQGSPKKASVSLDSPTQSSFKSDVRSESDIKTDEYFAAKEELTNAEEKLRQFDAVEHSISLKDIEMYLKHVGTSMHKKVIQNMIWEIDEKGTDMIDWEEFQLTYFRNINDTTGCEPNTFFHILEFNIFDGMNHRGRIVEDDCMEILYARYGSAQLEKELKFLFGDNLRAAGGDGTLSLTAYLETVAAKTGKRAILF